MSADLPRHLLDLRYPKAAQDYLHSLPLEHFMEATPQATQRKITLESLERIVNDRRKNGSLPCSANWATNRNEKPFKQSSAPLPTAAPPQSSARSTTSRCCDRAATSRRSP